MKSFEVYTKNPFLTSREVYVICDESYTLTSLEINNIYDLTLTQCMLMDRRTPSYDGYRGILVFDNLTLATQFINTFLDQYKTYRISKTLIELLFKAIKKTNQVVMFFEQCPFMTTKIKCDRYMINEMLNFTNVNIM